MTTVTTGIDRKDIRRLSKKLDKLGKETNDPKIRRKIMVKGGREVIKIARKHVPVQEGLVKKSIKTLRESKKTPGTYVGPQTSGKKLKEQGRPSNLPFILEYGSIFRAPTPFMRPAAQQGLPLAQRVIEKEYKKLVDKA